MKKILGSSKIYFDFQANALLTHFFQSLAISFVAMTVLGFVSSRYLTRKGKQESDSNFIRGTRLTAKVAPVTKIMKKKNITTYFKN